MKSETLKNRSDYEEHYLQLTQFLEFVKVEYKAIEEEAGISLEELLQQYNKVIKPTLKAPLHYLQLLRNFNAGNAALALAQLITALAHQSMISAESLSKDIREAFSSAPFPTHCGLHAAMAKDDWIDDENTLREITLREDFIGEWWDVPREHLHQCMIALSYLDTPGMAFYLPAYMTAILEEPEKFDSPRVRSSSWQVIHTMLPNDEEPELSKYFLEQFSLFDGAMKRVCVGFLEYVAACSAYDEHARKIAKEALAHEFWSIKS